ncbi:hypothetical protein F383_13304 [Gossypium arboreum]|uniref:Uncharacterized protein n=1 Tax=Gossypium arboreum TaxID=29729 RepID=A0A0B0Q3Q8_GOSAR|nr:hypothetical protein F383_13304 [Gossypium arboreum]
MLCPRHSLTWDHMSMLMPYPRCGLIQDLISPNFKTLVS